MSRFLCCVLSLGLLTGLAGCSGKVEEKPPTTEPPKVDEAAKNAGIEAMKARSKEGVKDKGTP